MSSWGRAFYGDPCGECGFTWPTHTAECVDLVRRLPEQMTSALGGTDGSAHRATSAWDARSYVCHVADNLRIWAERLVGATYQCEVRLVSYDADALADARVYSAIPISAALWSLAEAVQTWLAAVELAKIRDVRLLHPDRGLTTLSDVCATNAHDGYHHVYDVRRILALSPDEPVP